MCVGDVSGVVVVTVVTDNSSHCDGNRRGNANGDGGGSIVVAVAVVIVMSMLQSLCHYFWSIEK